MKPLSHRSLPVVLLVGMGLSAPASASLESRPAGMVYDTLTNLTWLADANYAQTSGYDADGLMNWATANAWANTLIYGGYSDWRLPTSDGCFGYNCTASEYGNLFYNELGGVQDQPITAVHNTNYDLFTNIQSAYYWTSTVYENSPEDMAWYFATDLGYQYSYGDKAGQSLRAWAVRVGDVAPVPIPAAAWLFGSALAGLSAMRRRR